MESIIHTNELTKSFGKTLAVNNVSLSVEKGEIYGFLGLNGAGKTTTIRMLLGMIQPSSGDSFLLGRKIPFRDYKLWNRIGYLVEIPYSYPELTVTENLEIIRRMRFLDNKDAVKDIIQKLRLEPYKDKKSKHLSLGNAQRLGLAKALIHNPEILILDEPSNGLDPAGIVEIRELLHDMAYNQGVTIFVSSHLLGEISKLATRIGIVHEGKMILEADTDELEKNRNKTMLINVNDKSGVKELLERNGFPVQSEGEFLSLSDSLAINQPEKVVSLMFSGGFIPSHISVNEEDLESYFLRTIKQKEVMQ